MPRGEKFTAEQIIGKLREAEIHLARVRRSLKPASISNGSVASCLRSRSFLDTDGNAIPIKL